MHFLSEDWGQEEGMRTEDKMRQRLQVRKCLSLGKMGAPPAVRTMLGF